MHWRAISPERGSYCLPIIRFRQTHRNFRRDKKVASAPFNNKLAIPMSRQKPMKYLKDRLDYFSAANTNQRVFKHIIRQSLRGPAVDCWELIQDNVQTINEFKV